MKNSVNTSLAMKINKNQKQRIDADKKRGFIALLILTFAFAAGTLQVPATIPVTLATMFIFIGLCGAYVLQLNPTAIKVFRPRVIENWRAVFLVPSVLWLCSVLYQSALGTFAWSYMAVNFVLLFLPTSLIYFTKIKDQRFAWAQGIALLAIWAPIEFALLHRPTLPPSDGIVSLFTLEGIVLTLFLFIWLGDFQDIAPTLRVKSKDVESAVWYFALFLAIWGLPFSFLSGLMSVPEYFPGWGQVIRRIFFIFFFVAIPEELVFRGIVQNSIEKKFSHHPKATWIALALGSLIFGIAHLNTGYGPTFFITISNSLAFKVSWAYFLFSIGAGVFYGLAFTKTRNVMAAALTHGLVDIIFAFFLAN